MENIKSANLSFYLGMAGLKGYLPSCYCPGESVEECARSLQAIHDFGRVRLSRLIADQYLDLEALSPIESAMGVTFGNEYCEITRLTLAEADLASAWLESPEDDLMVFLGNEYA